jgi:hypothetical protein
LQLGRVRPQGARPIIDALEAARAPERSTDHEERSPALDHVTVTKRGARNALSVDVRAILRAGVLERPAVALQRHAGMHL